ncbi:MAG: hypothetical protein WKF78_04615 [Candidatus Limnocylindrales bacterium]
MPIAMPGLVSRRSRAASASGRLRDPEVEHLDDVRRAVAGDQEHVLRLEIAMDDPLGVRGRERATDLTGDPQRARDVDRAFALDHAAELDALEELHHEVHAAVARGAGVGDVDDVRMADLRGGTGLAAEPLHQIRHPAVARVQDLQRDTLADLDVLGEVHLAHAALADQLDHAIAAIDLAADQIRLGFFQGLRLGRRRGRRHRTGGAPRPGDPRPDGDRRCRPRDPWLACRSSLAS